MAITLKHTRPVTDDELLELSRQNPGYQFERSAKGELIVTPAGMESGRASGEVVGQLRDWNQSDRPGVVFDSSTGFRMPDGSVLSPDASWVRRDRWDALTIEDRKKLGPFCPDAVFEIRSESNTLAELRDKMRAYLANGARVGVLVDPDRRTVEVYRPGREPEMHQDSKTVSLDPELAGFILNLESLFTA
ncbi:MAG TPA: Uma2 family endonuclease [bacterium]|nr:Uma2 family endonuclease [bacterium]